MSKIKQDLGLIAAVIAYPIVIDFVRGAIDELLRGMP